MYIFQILTFISLDIHGRNNWLFYVDFKLVTLPDLELEVVDNKPVIMELS